MKMDGANNLTDMTQQQKRFNKYCSANNGHKIVSGVFSHQKFISWAHNPVRKRSSREKRYQSFSRYYMGLDPIALQRLLLVTYCVHKSRRLSGVVSLCSPPMVESRVSVWGGSEGVDTGHRDIGAIRATDTGDTAGSEDHKPSDSQHIGIKCNNVK